MTVRQIARELLVAAMVLSMVLPTMSASASNAEAKEVVTDLQEALLESMQAEVGYAERVERLTPVIDQAHHLSAMANFALGRHASQLDRNERRQFVEVFSRLIVATYASRFDQYSGERFEYKSCREISPERMVVRTVLVTSKNEVVNLDYLVLWQDEKWAIVNVLANGVSDLALMRSEYTSILQDRGFDGLLDELRRQIDDLAKSS